MLSPKQREFVEDPSRRKLARCGRRAGKSFMDAVYMIIICLRFPDSPVLYAGLTRDSAKEIIWPILIAVLEELNIPHTPRESRLMIEFPNGSKITIFGCDTKNARTRLRGRKFRLVIFDETAFYAALDPLIYILLPMLADYGGSLCLTSSPGELLSGLFYEADQGRQKDKWSRYHWNIYDNPHFQKPAEDKTFRTRADEEIAFVLATEFRGDASRPEFRREWLGEWVEDSTTRVYGFTPANAVDAAYDMPKHLHAFGINLGEPFTHTLVISRYSNFSRDFQIIDCLTFNDLEVDEFFQRIQPEVKKYQPVTIAAYLDQYSPEVVDELKKRYQLPIVPVTRKDRTFYQKIMSSDFSSGFVKLVKKSTQSLIDELTTIVKGKDGEEISGQPNYLSNAALAVYRKVYQTHLCNFVKPKTEEELMIEQLEAKRHQEPETFYERIENELGYTDDFSDF